MRIVVLGPDGAGKSSVLAGLVTRLESRGQAVKIRHLKPRTVARLRGQADTLVVDPHGKPRRGALLSLVKIVVWLMEEWAAALFHEDGKALLLCDRYYHDLLVDPLRYRFGAPLWIARLIGSLMPRPNLWILLNAPSEVLQARKQEVSAPETARQCQAYREFIRYRSNTLLVDASQSLDQVLAATEVAVLDALHSLDRENG